jgi:hypothetical protein
MKVNIYSPLLSISLPTASTRKFSSKSEVLFDYLKFLVCDIVLLPATHSHNGSALPVIISSDDLHFPTNLVNSNLTAWLIMHGFWHSRR